MSQLQASFKATDGRRSGVAAGALVLALVALLWRDAAGPALGIESVAMMSALLADIAVLCAGVLFYTHWRVGLAQTTAWLVTAVVAFSLQGLHWFVLTLGTGPRPQEGAAWIASYQIFTTLGLGLLVVWSERLPVRHDPLVAGLVLGLLVTTGREVLLALPLTAPPTGAYAVIVVTLTAVGAVNAVALARFRAFSPWLRRRLCVASVLLGVGQAAAFPQEAPQWLTSVSIATNLLGAAVLVATAFVLARHSILAESEAVAVLQRRLKKAELGLHDDQTRLHELRATVAGLSSATRLLHHQSGISELRRSQLEQMMESELDRMTRLISGRPSAPPGRVDLDTVLGPVVERQRAAGCRIAWQPTGTCAHGRPDDIAEIVSILLGNVQRHAPRSRADLVVRTTRGSVEIVVTDSGPGVERHVRHAVFDWGRRGPSSDGQGVGLASARLLSLDLGGYLRLEDRAGPGATFILGLPMAEEAVGDHASTA
ncbi:HAMP domain-containing sensor histidine kinase [Nocardioides conyzicola]|uniref:histidine kinase n=1 Tax=Nocardioides conyzicola TaxID=1651781 RepID=A0ABP8XNL5_9ACTN